MRADLESKPAIVVKGILFLVLVVASAGVILLEQRTLRTGALLALLIWASARFYYFLFYVLERYVDPGLRYTGIVDLALAIMRRRR